MQRARPARRRSYTTTWRDSIPTAQNPTPPRAGSLTIVKHSDGSISGRYEFDPVGGEKFQSVLESFLQKNRPAGRHPHPRPATRRRRSCSGPTSRSPPARPPVLRTVKPHVVVTIGIEDLVDPATGPAARQHGLRRRHLRRPRPHAGLRRQRHSHRHRPRRPTLRPGPHPPGRATRTCGAPSRQRDHHCVFAGCFAPHYWCDVHHLVHWVR